MTNEYAGRVSFCVGTGRCGTTLLARLANEVPDVAGSHERARLGATFHMFCKWNDIPVDAEGFLLAKEEAIRADLKSHRFSFESSALLSHSLKELFSRFECKLVLLVRSPADTVASFAARGWFLQTPPRQDPSLPPSYYRGEKSRHFLGRNLPRGPEFERWIQLTQIGRIAWFWNARNSAVLDQFRRLPLDHCAVLRLEDLTYERYRELASFLGWSGQLDPETFNTLVGSRLNAGPNPPRTIDTWSKQERDEFDGETADLAQRLGYSAPGAVGPAPRLQEVLGIA